ncbi:MAG: hypothetical protein AAB586_02255 [Patescibacteria group bacterium]
MWKYAAAIIASILIVSLISSCGMTVSTPQLQQKVLGPRCPEWKLVINGWSFQLLPYDLQRRVEELMVIAQNRNTRYGTDPAGYRGDAFSRTLGPDLRKHVKNRAPVNFFLHVYYLDPKTAHLVRDLGDASVVNGMGDIVLPDDPRYWIVETIWPENFLSPIKSGGKHSLWLFGDEWKDWCTMNVHGLVP